MCISGGMIDDMHDPNDMDDDDEDDENLENDECQIHLNDNDDMNVMDAELNNDPFISISTMNNTVNHYMNVSSTINPNVSSTANDYYQNVMQLQSGESV